MRQPLSLLLATLTIIELLSVRVLASPAIVQLTTVDNLNLQELVVSKDGGTIAFSSTADLTGQNPSHYQLVFSIHSDGTNPQTKAVLTVVAEAFREERPPEEFESSQALERMVTESAKTAEGTRVPNVL